MMTRALVLCAWNVLLADPSDVERILTQVFPPILRDPSVVAHARSYFVSRQVSEHAPPEAWLRMFATPSNAQTVVAAVQQYLAPMHVEESVDPTGRDPLVRRSVGWYRCRLREVTDVALDLVSSVDSDFHRRAVRQVPDPYLARWTSALAYESELADHLHKYSVAFRRVDSAKFWFDFARWPLPRSDLLSPPGHWLWNILGI